MPTAADPVSAWLNLPPYSTRRRLTLLRELRGVVMGSPAEEVLLGRVLSAIRADEATLALENQANAPLGGRSPEGEGMDRLIDAALTAIDERLQRVIESAGDAEEANSADNLRDQLFPQGLRQHTQAVWAEQAQANLRVMGILLDPEQGAAISRWGLSRAVERLAILQPLFVESLAADSPGVSAEELENSRKAGRETLADLLVATLAEPDPQIRSELLVPFARAEEGLRIWRRRKGVDSLPSVEEADPGEPL
jgi:hypothetical protein